jgi:MFS family permease
MSSGSLDAGGRLLPVSGPLRHPWFALFIGSVVLWSTGAGVAFLVLPLLVLELTHSLSATATLSIARVLPYVLFGAVAGVLIDRTDKRKIIVSSDAVGLATIAAVPLAVAIGVFSLPLLYILVFALGGATLFWRLTVDFTVVPALVADDELTAANSLYLSADRVGEIAGPAIAGIAIAVTGTTGALWISAALFLPTIALFIAMPPLRRARSTATEPLSLRLVGREVGAGYSYIWRSRILRWLLVLVFAMNLGNNGIEVLIVYVLREEHALPPLTIGLAIAATGVLQILGSLAAPALARGRPLGRSMLAIAATMSISAILASLFRDWRLLLGAIGVRQAASGAHYVYTYLPRQLEVPNVLRGRVNGAFRTIILVATTASPALLSAIQNASSSSVAFAAAGALGLVGTAITFWSPLRDYVPSAPGAIDGDAPSLDKE